MAQGESDSNKQTHCCYFN